MTDKEQPDPPLNNIRGLIQDISEKWDERVTKFRKGTSSEHIRASEVRTLILIVRKPRTINELSEYFGISRQAAHSTLQRLAEQGLINMEFVEGSKRDKVATISAKGYELRRSAGGFIAQLEDEISEIIGPDELLALRVMLEKISTELKA